MIGVKILFTDVKFYGIVDFIQRSVDVIMILYHTTALSTTDYDNLALSIIISSTLLVLIYYQSIAALNRFFHEFVKTANEKGLVGTVLTFLSN